jgi:hypothetical protein
MGGRRRAAGEATGFQGILGRFVENVWLICGSLRVRCCSLRFPGCELLLPGLYVGRYPRLGISSAGKFRLLEVKDPDRE